MSAKEKAISDIKSELKETGKSFIMYSPKLNFIIKEIEKDYIHEQEIMSKNNHK